MKTLSAFLLLIIIGCGSPPQARLDYYANRTPEVAPVFVRSVDKPDDNYGLRNLFHATLSQELGNEKEALAAFARACEVADNIDLTSVGLTFVFSAKNRVLTGDPYERSSAHAFRGMLLYRQAMKTMDAQTLHDVRASYMKCLEHDKATEEEAFQNDWGLAYFMLAKVFHHLEDEGNMRSAIASAKTVFPNNPYVDEESIRTHNFTLLLGVGIGPTKYQGGGFMGIGETDQVWTSGPQSEQGPTIWIDGHKVGSASLIVDINAQAEHRPSQAAKKAVAVGRQAAQTALLAGGRVIPFLSLFAGAVDTSADLRSWDVQPAGIMVFSARLQPGMHTVSIKFDDVDLSKVQMTSEQRAYVTKHAAEVTQELQRYNQVHYYIPVRGDQPDNLYYFSCIRNKHNALTKK